jgi:hypothetical protein
MKVLSTLIFGLAAAGAGSACVAAYDNFFWDKELRAQLADKDKRLAALNDDIVNLKQGLGTLSDKNTAMLTLIDSSLDDTAALARGNQSAIEKIQSVIRRLAKLQADLRAKEQPSAP